MNQTFPASGSNEIPASGPFFSIVVPCCDVAPYVAECFESVLSQPFTDWEILAGVEESGDGTEAIVRSFAARDARFHVFTGPRSGSCSVPRNRGVELARGEYVLFLDGDDTIFPGSLGRLHDRITDRPGADLYPCALLLHNDITGRDEEIRDNYPSDCPAELTGPEATMTVHRHRGNFVHAQMQLSVFRRAFLRENALECVPGLRRQDCEFSPRALYLARRVVPLHELWYFYRRRPGAVATASNDPGRFHGDWAEIFRSLFAFHARVSRAPDFDPRVAGCWRDAWLATLFGLWFSPHRIRSLPRQLRAETLAALFRDGPADLFSLAAGASAAKRAACRWVWRFARHPALRPVAERFFALYFALSMRRKPWKAPPTGLDVSGE